MYSLLGKLICALSISIYLTRVLFNSTHMKQTKTRDKALSNAQILYEAVST